MKTTIMTKVQRRFYAISLLVISAGLVLFSMLNGCDEKKTPDAQVEARLKALEAGAPGVGTIMSGVQLHFAKLYFAGKAQNWPLAEFELYEVEENMDRAAALRPEEHGVNLVGLNDAFKQTQLAALRTATQNEDWNTFQSAYTEAVGVCNGCHEETNRPFIVITVPVAPPVPNQQWEAPTLIINMLVAIATTKIPILLQKGFWSMAHESRTDFSMLLGSIFLLIVGAGRFSLDDYLQSKRERQHA